MRLNETPLISAEEIGRRVAELAAAVSVDYAGRELLLVAVLKGSIVFLADLLRQLTVPATIEFIRAKSYKGTRSQGEIEFSCFPERPITGKHVLVIEDIVDTGETAAAILERFTADRPASLALCALLDKPARRETPVPIHYTGFTIADHFVVGYGLDYDQRGRELPDIRILERE